MVFIYIFFSKDAQLICYIGNMLQYIITEKMDLTKVSWIRVIDIIIIFIVYPAINPR